LGAISDELHQTTTCHLSLYPLKRKKIRRTGIFGNLQPGGSVFVV
jgi:hypothetical protein